MAINYIDDNGVRQIFSDIKSNLDSINNTAVSAYDRANEAYTIASSGSITPSTQTFNITGDKTFNITDGNFYINSYNNYNNYLFKNTNFVLNCNGFSITTYRNNASESYYNNSTGSVNVTENAFKVNVYSYPRGGLRYAAINVTNDQILLRVNLAGSSIISMLNNAVGISVPRGASIQLSDNGIYINDGRGHRGYLNMAKCI